MQIIVLDTLDDFGFQVNRLERTIVCVQEQTRKSTDKMHTEDSYQGALMF